MQQSLKNNYLTILLCTESYDLYSLNCDGRRQTSSFSIHRYILDGSKNIRCENVYTAIYQIANLHIVNGYSSLGIVRSKRNIVDTNQD